MADERAILVADLSAALSQHVAHIRPSVEALGFESMPPPTPPYVTAGDILGAFPDIGTLANLIDEIETVLIDLRDNP